MTPLTPLAAKDVSDRVAAILDDARKAVVSRLSQRRDLTPLLVLLWATIGRAMRRFARFAQWAAEGRPPSRATPPGPPRPPPHAERPRAPRLRLPQGFGWLLPLVPGVGNFGSQLRHAMLNDPELAAVLAAIPEAATMMRPLLDMLGSEPGPELKDLLPRRARPTRHAAPARAAADPPPRPIALLPPRGRVRAPG